MLRATVGIVFLSKWESYPAACLTCVRRYVAGQRRTPSSRGCLLGTATLTFFSTAPWTLIIDKPPLTSKILPTPQKRCRLLGSADFFRAAVSIVWDVLSSKAHMFCAVRLRYTSSNPRDECHDTLQQIFFSSLTFPEVFSDWRSPKSPFSWLWVFVLIISGSQTNQNVVSSSLLLQLLEWALPLEHPWVVSSSAWKRPKTANRNMKTRENKRQS